MGRGGVVVVLGELKARQICASELRSVANLSLLYFSVLPAAAALALLHSNPSTRHSISVSPSSVRVRFVRSNIFPPLVMRSANSRSMKTAVNESSCARDGFSHCVGFFFFHKDLQVLVYRYVSLLAINPNPHGNNTYPPTPICRETFQKPHSCWSASAVMTRRFPYFPLWCHAQHYVFLLYFFNAWFFKFFFWLLNNSCRPLTKRRITFTLANSKAFNRD